MPAQGGKKNPSDRVVATHGTRREAARAEIREKQIKQLQNVPQLREAVALILDFLGLKYTE